MKIKVTQSLHRFKDSGFSHCACSMHQERGNRVRGFQLYLFGWLIYIGFQTTSKDLDEIDEEIKKLECLANGYDNEEGWIHGN